VRRIAVAALLLAAFAMPSARADEAAGSIRVASPFAESKVNVVDTAFRNSGCDVADPTVQQVQGLDGFVVALGHATSVRAENLSPAPMVFDALFYSYDAATDRCDFAGRIVDNQPQLCSGTSPLGTQECRPTEPAFAVVIMSIGANGSFRLIWS
jgi:hypothetical protein